MRLHSLEVTAFGPFAETVTVDFDALGADGLFLLHGHTGAGKTSILDAVAFALYGTVPGARRDSKRLHSDHAEPATPPRVVLEATLGGRRIRLVRSPEFMRPKRKGVGTTKQNASASLTWLDGRGQNLTRFDEIGLEIERLLGMRADQFFQVVLLPQGDFARFLRAKNEDRGVLLERLFDTERFANVENWLSERRRASAARLDGSAATVERLAAQIAIAAGVDACIDPDPQEWAADLLVTARAERKTASDRLAVARLRISRVTAALVSARRTRDAQTRAARAQARLAELEDAADYRAVLTEELSAARRADPISARRRDLARAENGAVRALRSLRARESTVTATADGRALHDELSWPPVDTDGATLDRYIAGWNGECAVLDRVVHLDADVRRCERDAATLSTRLSTVEVERTAVEEVLANRPTEIALLRSERDAALSTAATLDGQRAVRDAAHDAAAAAVELSTVSRRSVDTKKTFEHARAHHDSARESWLDIRERRLDAMAGELAGQLEEGHPCAVCGSSEHPAPARAEHDAITRADEATAFEIVESAAAARDVAAARMSELDRELHALTTRGGDRAPGELAALLDAANDALDLAERAAVRAPEIDREIARLDADTAARRTRHHELTTECSALTERITSTATRLAELRRTIVEAAGADGSVQRRRDRLAATAASAADLRSARIDAVNAQRTVADATELLHAAASDAGFDSVEGAVAAVRGAERIAAIDTILADARDAAAGARSVLAEAEVVEALAQPPVDLAPFETAVAEADDHTGQCIARASDTERRAAELEGLTAQLWAAADRIGPLRSAHQELERLAEVVAGKGQNARKMSLRSYVLAARLEEVAAAASTRFRRMSGGRFEFVHTDDVGPRGTRGGLGLDIRDDHSGVIRSANTLSGGESFCASLALALGLADVVAAEAGGITLDTIFIDEGFGSLDSESLDSVMGVLDELRSGGRTVGIVSHVEEIRDRVPSRLHVIRGRHGSTVEVFAGV